MLLGVLVLSVARVLTPHPDGVGTHTQLGLPACFFLQWTGLPCPACGLTTCFTHMAHGALRAGVACHPIGALLFGLLAISIPLAMYAAVRGSAPFETWWRMHARHAGVALACALLAQWSLRIARLLLG
ncbi:MAG: DUF2752 domain-containing protein [Polyangiales bacterium]